MTPDRKRFIDDEIESRDVFLVVDEWRDDRAVTQIRIKDGVREILGHDGKWHQISANKAQKYKDAFDRERKSDKNFGARVKGFWRNLTDGDF